MADAGKGLREVLVASLQRLTVTHVSLDGDGALAIDGALLKAAGLTAHQRVEVANVSTGARFATWVKAAKAKSGDVRVTGAASHHVQEGHLLEVCAFGFLKPRAAGKLAPVMVTVGEDNTFDAPAPAPPPSADPKRRKAK
jgi:aspartate 1-decarboxylase